MGLIRQELSRISWSPESTPFQWITKSPCQQTPSLEQKVVRRGSLSDNFWPQSSYNIGRVSLS